MLLHHGHDQGIVGEQPGLLTDRCPGVEERDRNGQDGEAVLRNLLNG
jgi:hypothetical protein